MLRKYVSILVLINFLVPFSSSAVSPRKKVKVGILEGLAVVDSTSSERYRQIFESSLYYALGSVDRELSSCGYQLEVDEEFFDASDKYAAKTAAARLVSRGAWIVFGPRRSDHFIASVEGSGRVPVVSPMAGSRAVSNLRPPVFSMYPGVSKLAKAAVSEVSRRKYGKKFAAFVDASCLACRDFLEEFTRVSTGKLNRIFYLDSFGEAPDVVKLVEQLRTSQVDFLLLPNYSKFSGSVIRGIQDQFPTLKIVGADGWGDGQFGFLEGYGIRPEIQGISVRGGLPADDLSERLGVVSLDRSWRGERLRPPIASLAAISFFRRISKDLCRSRPGSPPALHDYLSKQDADHFREIAGVSIYELKDGQLRFSKYRELP